MSTERPEGLSPALELRGVVKRFGAVIALNEVNLTVERGRVHALLGENGAGKSTLMRVAYGLTAPEAGGVRLFGQERTGLTVRDAVRAGVGMVHQHMSLVPSLTVAENLVLGGEGLFRREAAEDLLHRVGESSGLSVRRDARARDLSIVEQQRLEILKALARDARLLILDEPTAVLAPSEVDDLLRWIRVFAAGGGSVVLVTHKLREALAVADDVTVLKRGRTVFEGRANASTEQSLTRAIFPESNGEERASAAPMAGDAVVVVDALNVADAGGVPRIRRASFQLHRHEIIGIAAVEASGHRHLLMALAGRQPITGGTLQLPQRVALIPADRGRDALIPEFTLTENLALHELTARRGLMPWRSLTQRTNEILKRFDVVASSASAPARTLSGGNQQRLLVGRELEHDVDLVVADNPTRGLDIRATDFVRERLREAAARGAAVVVHSSDLDEVLALASRVLVVFGGHVSEVAVDRGVVGRAMLGAA